MSSPWLPSTHQAWTQTNSQRIQGKLGLDAMSTDYWEAESFTNTCQTLPHRKELPFFVKHHYRFQQVAKNWKTFLTLHFKMATIIVEKCDIFSLDTKHKVNSQTCQKLAEHHQIFVLYDAGQELRKKQEWKLAFIAEFPHLIFHTWDKVKGTLTTCNDFESCTEENRTLCFSCPWPGPSLTASRHVHMVHCIGCVNTDAANFKQNPNTSTKQYQTHEWSAKVAKSIGQTHQDKSHHTTLYHSSHCTVNQHSRPALKSACSMYCVKHSFEF